MNKLFIVFALSFCCMFSACSSVGDIFTEAEKKGIKLRSKPITDLAIQKQLHVKNYGAISDDNIADNKAIQQAIEDAKQSSVPVKIVFDKGTYILQAPEGRHCIIIENAKDIILDGCQAEFKIKDPTKLFLSIINSERIIVKDLSVDYEISPHAQGWVIDVNQEDSTFVVRLDPDYPDVDEPHFRNADYRWGFIKDRHNLPAYKEGTEYRLYLERWEKIEKGIYKYKIRHKIKLKTVEVGDPFVQISRVDGALFAVDRSEDVTFLNLRLYSSPNCFFGTGYCSRVNYIDITAAPKDGSWQASGADGCFNYGGRQGPWVENCYFEAIGDDNLIIKGFRAYCINVVDSKTFDLAHAQHRFLGNQMEFSDYLKRDKNNDKWMVRAGDNLTVVDPVKEKIIARPKVTEVTDLQYGVRIKVDKPIPGLAAGTDFEKSLSFFNEDASLAGFVVKNNIFKSAVRFGFLLKSHDGFIDGNVFERHSDQSIAMINTWQEFGSFAYNLIIKNNTFKLAGGWPIMTAQTDLQKSNRNRNIYGILTTAVTVPFDQWNVNETDVREIKNILIEGNRFINWWQNPAIAINNGYGIQVKNNYFELEPEFAKTSLSETPIAIKVVNSTNIVIKDNVLTGESLDQEQSIKQIRSKNVVLKNNIKK